MGRRWLFRVAAIVLGLTPFLVVEGCLRWLDLPSPSAPLDPFLDLSQLRPLFLLESDGYYRIPAERYRLFAPAEFAQRKPPSTRRVFALGGSTTQGEPYGPATAFPEWLRLQLQLADPNHTYEVINAGGLSYASYRVLPILREVLNYQPDLIVIYTGQNEFLEARELSGWRELPQTATRWLAWWYRWRTVQALRGLGPASSSPNSPGRSGAKTSLRQEVDALLDNQGGLEKYRRETLEAEEVIASFRWNLEEMIAACQSRAVPLLLVVPTVNLKDCPPFKVAVDTRLPNHEQVDQAWRELQAGKLGPQDLGALANHILTLDPQHAGAHYLLGQLAWQRQDWEAAEQHWTAAKDFDVCPLRAVSRIQESVRVAAQSWQVPCVDADALFRSRSPHGIVGREWLIDHVHPGIEGHQRLGEAIFAKLQDQGWLPGKQPLSDTARQQAYRQHLSGLGEDYFIRGKQRLEGLLLWTQGRAKKVEIHDPPSASSSE
jgi:hypothetical protein